MPTETDVIVACAGWVDDGFLDSAEYLSGDINSSLKRIPNMNMRARTAAVGIGDTIFIIGGFNFGNLSSVESYTMGDTQWRVKKSMKNARSEHAATVGEINGQKFIYVFGGVGAKSLVEKYNVDENRWEDVKQMRKERKCHAAVIVENDIYILGGKKTDTCEKYSSTEEEYKNVPDMKKWRFHFGAVHKSGKIYVAGGEGESGFLNTCEVFDISKQTWTIINPMMKQRLGVQLGLIGDKIIAVGGQDENNVKLKTTEFYNEKTKIWEYGPEMTGKRNSFGLATIKVAKNKWQNIENKLSKLSL